MKTLVATWLFAIALIAAIGLAIASLPNPLPSRLPAAAAIATPSPTSIATPSPTSIATPRPTIQPSPIARPTIPPCEEDEVVWGSGDFHADHYWDRYSCIPVDEIVKDVNASRP